MKVKRETLLNSLPPEWPEDLMPAIQRMVAESGTKIVVLDDDPTGNQTVHSVAVLTEWSQLSLEKALSEPDAVFYVLTNSRSVPLERAREMNRDIATNLKAASQTTGRDFVLVSRSDSTLRGHYPGEVEALVEALDQPLDGTLVIPFFLEGGRVTINDTHYVTEGDWLVPAAETEYARDTTFGYQSSNLCAWISEKHQGGILPEEVVTVSINDLRNGGPDAVTAKLERVQGGKFCVINCVTYCDMEVFVAGLLRAEAAGQRFVYRTAASFVRVRGGIAPRPLLTGADLVISGNRNGGLILVGSHVHKSTVQTESARTLPGVTSLEIEVERLLDAQRRDEEIERVAGRANVSLSKGRDTLIFTCRRVITGTDKASSLQIGQCVSSALVSIVKSLSVEPAWFIAKGGITASDTATEGLRVKRAKVLGQAIPGIPVWRTGKESRWPGLVYVVFPGNVGGTEALAEMIRILRAAALGSNSLGRSAQKPNPRQ